MKKFFFIIFFELFAKARAQILQKKSLDFLSKRWHEKVLLKENYPLIRPWDQISHLGMFEGCVALSPKGHSQSKVLSSGKFFFHGGSVMVKRFPFSWITIPIKSCGLYVHVKVGRHFLNHPTEIMIGKLKIRIFFASIAHKTQTQMGQINKR